MKKDVGTLLFRRGLAPIEPEKPSQGEKGDWHALHLENTQERKEKSGKGNSCSSVKKKREGYSRPGEILLKKSEERADLLLDEKGGENRYSISLTGKR